ncbi:gas vesicle protein [Actinocorallia libanotica]|uniref:Gas vesicle protein GvpA/GvpJ/GvpM family n=1 Tax=Actinocorallia libanotica TaxID=46162 RepID=A0ABP4ARR8_9ACTN
MAGAVEERPEFRTAGQVRGQPVALVDLLDRLLAGGVVIAGDVTISIADVDLVRISLRAVIASIRPEMARVLECEEADL